MQGNYIGTNAAGTTGIGNGWDGITMSRSRSTNSATNNLIGGIDAGTGNLIAYNTNYGVAVNGVGNTGNRILRNSIYGNGWTGIDLGPNDSVTPNDPGDGDTEGNNLQNYPVLISGRDQGQPSYGARLFEQHRGTYLPHRVLCQRPLPIPPATAKGKPTWAIRRLPLMADGNAKLLDDLAGECGAGTRYQRHGHRSDDQRHFGVCTIMSSLKFRALPLPDPSS